MNGVDAALVGGLHDGFPLCDRPFAEVGRALGVAEDELIERLRGLVACGALARFGPLYLDAGASASQMLDRQLMDATQSGLPLVPEPYEALGAMLGVSSREVQARMAAMLARGQIRRIGAIS